MAVAVQSACDLSSLIAAVAQELHELLQSPDTYTLASSTPTISEQNATDGKQIDYNGHLQEVATSLETVVAMSSAGSEMPLHLLSFAKRIIIPLHEICAFLQRMCVEWVTKIYSCDKEANVDDPYTLCCERLRVWLAVLSFVRIQRLTSDYTSKDSGAINPNPRLNALQSMSIDDILELLASADAVFFALDIHGCGLLGVPELLPLTLAVITAHSTDKRYGNSRGFAVDTCETDGTSIIPAVYRDDALRSPTALLCATSHLLSSFRLSSSRLSSSPLSSPPLSSPPLSSPHRTAAEGRQLGVSLSEWREYVLSHATRPNIGQELQALLTAVATVRPAFDVSTSPAGREAGAWGAATLSTATIWRAALDSSINESAQIQSLCKGLGLAQNAFNNLLGSTLGRGAAGALAFALSPRLPAILASYLAACAWPLSDAASRKVFEDLLTDVEGSIEPHHVRMHVGMFIAAAQALGLRKLPVTEDQVVATVMSSAKGALHEVMGGLLSSFQKHLATALSKCKGITPFALSLFTAPTLPAPSLPTADPTHMALATLSALVGNSGTQAHAVPLTIDTASTPARSESSPRSEQGLASPAFVSPSIPTLKVVLADVFGSSPAPTTAGKHDNDVPGVVDASTPPRASVQASFISASVDVKPPSPRHLEDSPEPKMEPPQSLVEPPDSSNDVFASNAVTTALRVHRQALQNDFDSAVEDLLSRPPGAVSVRESDSFQIDRLRNLRAQIKELDIALSKLKGTTSGSSTAAAPTATASPVSHAARGHAEEFDPVKEVVRRGAQPGKRAVMLRPLTLPSQPQHFMVATASSTAFKDRSLSPPMVSSDWQSALRSARGEKQTSPVSRRAGSASTSQERQPRDVKNLQTVVVPQAAAQRVPSFYRPTQSSIARKEGQMEEPVRRITRGRGVATAAPTHIEARESLGASRRSVSRSSNASTGPPAGRARPTSAGPSKRSASATRPATLQQPQSRATSAATQSLRVPAQRPQLPPASSTVAAMPTASINVGAPNAEHPSVSDMVEDSVPTININLAGLLDGAADMNVTPPPVVAVSSTGLRRAESPDIAAAAGKQPSPTAMGTAPSTLTAATSTVLMATAPSAASVPGRRSAEDGGVKYGRPTSNTQSSRAQSGNGTAVPPSSAGSGLFRIVSLFKRSTPR